MKSRDYFERGDVYFDFSYNVLNLSKAIDLYKQAQEHAESDEDKHKASWFIQLTFSRINKLQYNKYYDEEIKQYQSLVNHFDTAYIKLADAYENKGRSTTDIEQKINYYNEAIIKYKLASDKNLLLAREKLVKLYKKIIELGLDNKFPNIKNEIKFYQAKSKQLKNLEKSDYIKNGDAYYLERDFYEALIMYNKAIACLENDLSQHYEETHFKRGKTYLMISKYVNAIEDFDLALSIKLNANIVCYKAMAYRLRISESEYFSVDLPHCQSAIQNFETALKLNFDITIIHSELLNMRRHIANTYLNCFDETKAINATTAISAYHNLITLYPEDERVPLWMTCIAYVYKQQNNPEKAFDCYKEIFNKYPTCGVAYYHRALLYKDLGESKKAMEDFIKAVEYDRVLLKYIKFQKGYIFKAINILPQDEKVQAYKDYVNRETILGEIAHQARGDLPCNANHGTLKKAHKRLVKLSEDNSEHPTKQSNHITLGFIKNPHKFKSTSIIISDDNLCEMSNLNKNLRK